MELLPSELLAAVLISCDDAVPHRAITNYRRVCRAWKTLIDTDGFATQWDDACRFLSSRARHWVLQNIRAAATLRPGSHEPGAHRVAALLRDVRSSRLPRLDEHMHQEFRDPVVVDLYGVAHYSSRGPPKFAEDGILIVTSLGGLLMLVSFTGQHEPFSVDVAGCNHRAGFSLHAWAGGERGFVRVLAVTTVDTENPVTTPSGAAFSSTAGSLLTPVRHVHQVGLDLVEAGAAAAGHGELGSSTLLAAVCIAGLARCFDADDALLNGSNTSTYHAYVRAVLGSAAAPTTSHLEHWNAARGERDGDVFPGLSLLYWGADGVASDDLRRALAAELVRWRPGIADGRAWWPAGCAEWLPAALASGLSQRPVRAPQVCCGKCMRKLITGRYRRPDDLADHLRGRCRTVDGTYN